MLFCIFDNVQDELARIADLVVQSKPAIEIVQEAALIDLSNELTVETPSDTEKNRITQTLNT